MTKLIIVESPSKAKTISKYLGKDYLVTSSFGHIRGLPSKQGSVDPEKNFSMIYENNKGADKHIKNIMAHAKKCDEVYIASDPDREGEAIAWHVAEVMKEKKDLKNTKVKRIVFHEITKKAILDSFKSARDLDMSLINAQKTRQALDYLVGFTLSPLLWKKLPGSRSAGRVQSVALRLICERESEIEAFQSKEYWSISGIFQTDKKEKIKGNLIHFHGKKLEKFSITTEKEAQSLVDNLKKYDYFISDIKEKQVKENPSAPFTTSTMLQEASKKLGFTAKKTSSIAQKLYEGIPLDKSSQNTALITYMRTDSVRISDEAVNDIRKYVQINIGKDFIPKEKRIYNTKTRNAQEAHEAIRPIDCTITPESLGGKIGKDEWKLYNLIWHRTVASQMASAILNKVILSIDAKLKQNQQTQFRAIGSTVAFKGFKAIYQEEKDEATSSNNDDKNINDKSDKDIILPPVKVKQELDLNKIDPQQHFTQPPPRYSEASLVKNLEELGIGRPSTYSGIISILQDRGYVLLDKKRFQPENRGRVVTTFLTEFFSKYVDYDFTAGLESKLDDISNGQKNLYDVLNDFWNPFSATNKNVSEMKTADVISAVEKKMESFLFADSNGDKTCPQCKEGTLGLKMGRFSPFIGCSQYPSCSYSKSVMSSSDGEASDKSPTTENNAQSEFPINLGQDKNGNPITIRSGPYGLYVQMDLIKSTDDNDDKSKKKAAKGKKSNVKRASIPKGKDHKDVDLLYALGLLSMPRTLGNYEGSEVKSGIGRFGPYILYDGKYISLKGYDPITIEIQDAIPIILEYKSKKITKKK